MTDLEIKLRKLIADQQQLIRRQAREISEWRGAVAALTAPYEAPRAATSFRYEPPPSAT
jgi:hypothetical protein